MRIKYSNWWDEHLRLSCRIDISNFIRPNETLQISRFWIKYEFCISFKRAIWEKLDKKMDGEDEMLMMGHVSRKRKMRRRWNHQQRKQWVREIFLQRESHGALWRELWLEDRESFSRLSLLWYRILQLCATFMQKIVMKFFWSITVKYMLLKLRVL